MAVAVGLRRRLRVGPALRVAPLPFASLTLSACLHLALIVAAVIAIKALNEVEPKAYVVNLVPAVAAVGTPRGLAPAPSHPQRRPEPAPPPAPTTRAPELPDRHEVRSTAPPEMPARSPSQDIGLPERTLPPRTSAPPLPRLEQKELPTVASTPGKLLPQAAPPAATAPATPGTGLPQAPAPPPPAPLGRAGGSSQGAGAVTLDVDFPYAWYLRAVHGKISERWQDKALPGQQPVAVFEIGRDGRLLRLAIEKVSGNPLYDQTALRAISEAAPFPPLPDDFKASLLRIHLGFSYSRDRG